MFLFFRTCALASAKAMEIDASPDFCHLDVASSETALPICRSAPLSVLEMCLRLSLAQTD